MKLFDDIYNSSTSVTEWVGSLNKFQEKGVIWANPNSNRVEDGGKGLGIENMFLNIFLN